eukprot:7041895-Pyramimonas_sp.AAC.2
MNSLIVPVCKFAVRRTFSEAAPGERGKRNAASTSGVVVNGHRTDVMAETSRASGNDGRSG